MLCGGREHIGLAVICLLCHHFNGQIKSFFFLFLLYQRQKSRSFSQARLPKPNSIQQMQASEIKPQMSRL